MVLLPEAADGGAAGSDSNSLSDACDRRRIAAADRLSDPSKAPALQSALTMASIGLLTAAVSIGPHGLASQQVDAATMIANIVTMLDKTFPAADAPALPAAQPAPASAAEPSSHGGFVDGAASVRQQSLVEWDADVSAAWRRFAPDACTDWKRLRPILSRQRASAVLCGGVVARYARGVVSSNPDWDVFIVGTDAAARLASFYEVAATVVRSMMLDNCGGGGQVIIESLGSVWQLTSAAWQRPVQLILTSCVDAAEVVADFDMDAARGVVLFGDDDRERLVCPPDACHVLRTGDIRDVRARALPARLVRYGRDMGYGFAGVNRLPMEMAAAREPDDRWLDATLAKLSQLVKRADVAPAFCGAIKGRRSADTRVITVGLFDNDHGYMATQVDAAATVPSVVSVSLEKVLRRCETHVPTPMTRYVANDEDHVHASGQAAAAAMAPTDRCMHLRRMRPTQTAAGVLHAATRTLSVEEVTRRRSLRMAASTQHPAQLHYRKPYDDVTWRAPVITLRRATVSGVALHSFGGGKTLVTISDVGATEPCDWHEALEAWMRATFGAATTVAKLRHIVAQSLVVEPDEARRVTAGDVVDIECYVKHLYLPGNKDVEWHQSACALRITSVAPAGCM